jgi:hypothetical protein
MRIKLSLMQVIARWLSRRRARAREATRRPAAPSPFGVWLNDTVQYHH